MNLLYSIKKPGLHPDISKRPLAQHRLSTLLLATMLISAAACNKLVQIPQPSNTITVEKLYSSDANANAAVASIYSQLNVGGTSYQLRFGNGLTTIAAGASADELNIAGFLYSQFQKYTMLVTDGQVLNSFWAPAYYSIYQANAAIEALASSAGVSADMKKTLTGEAKFVRGFSHFYLVNLFGAVPLVTQSTWSEINLLKRAPVDSVYAQIIRDLTDAQAALPAGYSAGGGEKIRANKWAATALLARVYLYRGDWANAAKEASLVINSGNFRLNGDPDSVFLKNSDEAILQWQTENVAQSKYATLEGNAFNPTSHTASAAYTLTSQLLAAFEPGDIRRIAWVDSTMFAGKKYYYPSKYNFRIGTAGNVPEYYMILRYAEQYLIRAEALANTGSDLAGAVGDLNTVRRRAGLADLDPSLGQTAILAAIAQERRIEFFDEWGHRWFDLKRTGQADIVLSGRAGWRSEIKLWPIPATELINDPNLTQNPGY